MRRPRRFGWADWTTERLLRLELRELGLTIEGTWLEDRVGRLHDELEQRGLTHRPHIWLSDEWFSPTAIPGFAMPFYLAHPRLMRLERQQMLGVEGGTVTECMQIMRHETGHAIQHAYRLHRRRRWQRLFGNSSRAYPEHYRPNPASKSHVQHLRLWYAQSHPDEDFAETFAVWLRPGSDWRTRYASWPVALKKLEYVDELMGEIGSKAPLVRTRATHEPLDRIRKTLAQHYAAKRARYAVDFPNTYDLDLIQLFTRGRGGEAASSFIRRNRVEIRRIVARWSEEYELTLDTVLSDMITRCRELRLRAVGPERRLITDVAVLLAVKTMQSLYSRRREWIAL